eukprot:CAMPEP_0113398124 /NCGR_PEP_ID=MMETSP0013_2-20120614/14770_1 /TAXON_ID=2843 ORGANISM="Skeletonema costatum, Strain 1716" /NCGR_SAMPLE_ID=MMETSP0013_2 /ASSEMBLY_ACC=CAM_ASM_000158 /LENGTH=396 /DNA_ID=CAMNT_0000282801 /DNA_START=69 /DNA_END=1259 /DNA_ORIENTATION=+ /assembly_acc=CAM_ASM_000158
MSGEESKVEDFDIMYGEESKDEEVAIVDDIETGVSKSETVWDAKYGEVTWEEEAEVVHTAPESVPDSVKRTRGYDSHTLMEVQQQHTAQAKNAETRAREIAEARARETKARDFRTRTKVDDLKKSYEDEYTRLNFRFERALIEHKLALQYFEFRSFYFVFLPVTTIATLITIIGFLISGTTQDDGGGTASSAAEGSVEVEPLVTGQSKQIWSLVVGALGAITTLLSAIGKRANYQSQSDMHRSAVKALEKICLTIVFERDWFDRNARNIDLELEEATFDPNVYEKFAGRGADLKTHQASFKAMLDACCDSPAPAVVVQAFNKLDSLFAKQVYNRDAELGMVSDVEHDIKYFYDQLWTVFSTHWLWPLKAPLWLDVGECYLKWKMDYEGTFPLKNYQ